jgi:hypothetical protein
VGGEEEMYAHPLTLTEACSPRFPTLPQDGEFVEMHSEFLTFFMKVPGNGEDVLADSAVKPDCN